MRLWKAMILISVLISPLILSSCDLLGIGGKSKEQEYFEQQLELIKKQQEANQKAQEEYYENLKKGLEEYMKQYAEYQQAQQEAQIQAIQQAQQKEKEQDIPYN